MQRLKESPKVKYDIQLTIMFRFQKSTAETLLGLRTSLTSSASYGDAHTSPVWTPPY